MKLKWILPALCILLSACTSTLTVPAITTEKIPDDIRAQQIKEMEFGMFICWSFSTFSGHEWTPTLDKDTSYFKATGCDTDQWCQTAKEAGMNYILFLSKHHDGFCLWDTATTDKKVTNSPLGIDVLAKLRKSCDKYGIKLALYFSEGDWNWPGAVDGKNGNVGAGINPEIKKAQLKELLTKYGPIEFMWMDHAVGTGGLAHKETVEWVHKFQPNCFVGFNSGQPAGRLCLRERGRPGEIGDVNATKYNKDAEASYAGYLAAEFTYPILPSHKGGADWFYSLPKHDNLCHSAKKLYKDYFGARKYGNIFSINVGPNYEGRLRDIDVKTLHKVGEMIRSAGFRGKIIYPWNATTAIVKAGEKFTVWFDAHAGQNVTNAVLRGPYNSVFIPKVTEQTGSWVYDEVSGNTYNTRITVPVPAGTPEERYDLVLNTSAGQVISQSSVKVVKKYKKDYTIFHISDTHMAQGAKINGHPQILLKISGFVDIANIIGPEMVFITGDVINDSVERFPDPQERADFYYKGHKPGGVKGVHGFNAAAFSAAGNHDFLERSQPRRGQYDVKSKFWNKYHGLQSHHFEYGNTRFMVVNDGWVGFDWGYQLEDHASWLDDVGPGNLRVAAYHKSEVGIMGEWAKKIDLGLAVIGHNHHLAHANPYNLGGKKIQYYADSVREHFHFNLFRVDGNGNYTVVNNEVAVENWEDKTSVLGHRLTLEYAKSNDGTSQTNTATLVNKFDVEFPRARVRFVMPKGAYEVSKGVVEQVIETDVVSVIDVRVELESNSTTLIDIALSSSSDLCPDDPKKTSPGLCGCGVPEGTCAKPALTATNGSGDGNYAPLENAVITADPAPAGQEFDAWVINSGSPSILNVRESTTLLRLGESAAEVTAAYKDLPTVNDAVFVSQVIPELVPGESVTVSITMRNTGTTTWTKDRGYQLGSVGPVDNTAWGLSRVNLSRAESIAPDAEKTFTFNITVPTAEGVYSFQWKMVQEDVEWFGYESNIKSIRVGEGGDYFDDCDTRTGWSSGGSLKLNNIDKKQGSCCLEFTGGGPDEFQKVFPIPYNSGGSAADTVVQFWYYVSDPSKMETSNQVEIGSGGKADFNEYSWTLGGLSAGWNFVSLKISDAAKMGNPDLDTINWFRIYRFKSGTVTTMIDAIEILDPGAGN